MLYILLYVPSSCCLAVALSCCHLALSQCLVLSENILQADSSNDEGVYERNETQVEKYLCWAYLSAYDLIALKRS